MPANQVKIVEQEVKASAEKLMLSEEALRERYRELGRNAITDLNDPNNTQRDFLTGKASNVNLAQGPAIKSVSEAQTQTAHAAQAQHTQGPGRFSLFSHHGQVAQPQSTATPKKTSGPGFTNNSDS